MYSLSNAQEERNSLQLPGADSLDISSALNAVHGYSIPLHLHSAVCPSLPACSRRA